MASAGPSRSLCSVCSTSYAIYTCPRCKIRTCSLPCSSSHKSTTNCSGERDKAAFVNMKDYGWGTLMSDYTYLEQVGRKAGEWGAVIGKSSYGKPPGRGGPTSKRDILKSQLEMQDISIDLLPVGMARRQHNQSIWDFKNKTFYMTLEFKFHPPHDSTNESTFSLLTHRNNLNTPLLALIANCIQERRNREKSKGKQKEQEAFPSWLLDLVEGIPPDSSPFDSLIRAPISPISLTIADTRPKAVYHRVVPTEPLITALHNTHFVEFPTLELWPQGEFSGVIVNQHAETYAQEIPQYERGSAEDAERRAKRRKVELKAGKKAISGLLNGYGSDDEEESKEHAQTGLALLGGYADSDDEKKMENSDDEVGLSPEVLLELMKNAQGQSSWTEDGEQVDWGDEDSEEDE